MDNVIRTITEARQLIQEYGLDGWRFEFDNAKNRVGCCHYTDKKITYSRYFLHVPWEQIYDTLLHEVAHAIAGPKAGHGPRWRQVARQIGATPERCAPPEVKTAAKPNYVIKCEVCGTSWKRHRLKRQMHSATHCGVQVKIYRITYR